MFDIAFTFNPALLAYGIVGGSLGVTAFWLIRDAAGIEQRPPRDPAAGVTGEVTVAYCTRSIPRETDRIVARFSYYAD